MNRPVPDVRIERPGPRGPKRNSRPETSVCDQINGNRSECCEKAVDRQQNPRRGVAVDTKNFKDSSHQVGIEWRLPCAGPGISFIGTSESPPLRDGPGHASHFPSESEMIVPHARAILPENSYRRHLQRK